MTHAVHVHFLNLVRDVFTFSRVAHAVTFNGMSKDYRRFAFGFLRFLECSVDFLRIVTTTVQCPDLLVSPVCNQCCGFRIFTEEVFANIRTIFRFEGLVIAVNGFVHQLDQFTAGIFTQQFVPTATPHHFDHVPASTFEDAFQFVDDLAVTVTGPSRRCRLQLITKTRLSSFSRVAMVIAPLDSGSSISPSPRNA